MFQASFQSLGWGLQSLLIYERKVFQTLAPNHHQQPSRTLIQLQCHVSPSCHFISVMTHRFSIYATNCIASGCGPNQSQPRPSVHLGKPRSLCRAAGKSFLFPHPNQTGCSLLAATWLDGSFSQFPLRRSQNCFRMQTAWKQTQFTLSILTFQSAFVFLE